VFAVLFLTGALWLPADRLKDAAGRDLWSALAPALLTAHGGAAMLTLMLLGALVPLHVLPAWGNDKNRALGAAMAMLTLLLIATAFGLYYIGSETARGWASDLHIALGLAFPVLLTAHAVTGRRRCARRAKPVLSVCAGVQAEPPGADACEAAGRLRRGRSDGHA